MTRAEIAIEPGRIDRASVLQSGECELDGVVRFVASAANVTMVLDYRDLPVLARALDKAYDEWERRRTEADRKAEVAA